MTLAWTTEVYDLSNLAAYHRSMEVMQSDSSGKIMVLTPEGEVITGDVGEAWGKALRNFKQSGNLSEVLNECPLPKDTMRKFVRRPGEYDRAFAEKRLSEMALEEEKVVALTHLQPRDEASAKEEVVLGVSEEELQAVQWSLDQMPGVDVKAQDVVRAIGNYLKCMDVAIEADLARREGGASSSDAPRTPPPIYRASRGGGCGLRNLALRHCPGPGGVV